MRHWFLLSMLTLSLPLSAEVIQIPVGQQGAAQLDLPQRGQSQASVLQRYGLPDEEHAPVGQPPITRWDYRYFSVYFEYKHVVNAVQHHQPQQAHPSQGAQQ